MRGGWELPQSQCGAVQLNPRGGQGILNEVLLGGHLPIDVPVEAGGGEGVEGGAVGHQGVARVVDGECPSDDGPLVRQIWRNINITCQHLTLLLVISHENGVFR